MKTKGLHQYRFKDNPEERHFAEGWDEDVADSLKYLLCPPEVDQRFPPVPSDRDVVVAATVIQWLGSAVGQSFLQKMGYEKTNNKTLPLSKPCPARISHVRCNRDEGHSGHHEFDGPCPLSVPGKKYRCRLGAGHSGPCVAYE